MSRHFNKTKTKTSQLRIIGGKFKRQSIAFLDEKSANDGGLRPTPDRLRETLFNWLAPYLHEADVLDVCAGSGALGFEAISRGAGTATLIEPNKKQAALLHDNAQKLKIETKVRIIGGRAEKALPTLKTSFDIVFLDPPYDLDLWQPLLALILAHGLLAKGGLIYIEADRTHDALNLPDGLEPLKETKVGQVWAGVYRLAVH